MPDPFDAHEIARKSFESGRRGYEPQEVRAYLHEVSSHVERLQRELRDLKERAERAEARLGLAEAPDEAMLMQVLGEETTRVLTSAREAASEIKAKAEAAAERIVGDATSEAAQTRSTALQDADKARADAAAESEGLLTLARTELDRRSAEAEEAATRIRDEAAAAAQAARDEGSAALAQAEVDAEAIREAAREEGRTMVAEAQAVRERVLKDLAARRKKARQQVEKLNAGRERLLEAYDVVRTTVDTATTELHQSLSDARLAGDAAARRVEDEDDLTIEELDAEVAHAALADLTPLPGSSASEVDELDDDGPGPLSGEVPAISVEPEAGPSPDPGAGGAAASPEDPEPTAAAEEPVDLDERRSRKRRRKPDFAGVDPEALVKVEPPSTPDEGIRILAEPAAPPVEAPAPADTAPPPEEAPAAPEEPEPTTDEPVTVDDAAGDETEPADATPPADEAPAAEDDAPAPEDGADGPNVGDLFARLRSETETPDEEETADTADPQAAATDEAEGDESTDEPTPFQARDERLAPIDRELSKRLKRALADEQNEVLDRLRRAKPQGVDDLLPSGSDHASRWAETVDEHLVAAAGAGAETVGADAPAATGDLADELARSLTEPLRDRIDRSFAASDGNLDDVADRVRALYREWKGQRLQDTARHYLAAAYARGLLEGLDPGASVQWVLDPDHAACPDCSDNVLAGSIPRGDEFPTGQTCAPAHPGCRCLVLAVSS